MVAARRDRPLTPAAASHTVEKTSVMLRRSTQTATFCYFRESTPNRGLERRAFRKLREFILWMPWPVSTLNYRCLLVFANGIVGTCYVGAVGIVGLRLASGQTAFIGSAIFIACLLSLAYGHFRLRVYAVMMTAAICGAASLLTLVQLFFAYEPALLPPFRERALQFVLSIVLTSLAMLNYFFCKTLKWQRCEV